MWRNGLRVGAMVAVLAACHDARLVAPDLDGAAARLRGAEAVRFPCAWSVRSEGGPHRYRYGRAAVAVPRAALAPDGATAEYRYIVQAPGADPVYVARCVVPATRAAVEHLDRRFGVVRATTASTTGDAVARGCVSDGECILEPITVQPCAGPAPGPTESAPDCGGGGGGDPGWWTGGGGPYEPPPDDGGGGGGGGDDPGGEDPGGHDPYPPEPCDTGDPVVDSEAVQDAFDELWRQSNASASNLAQRQEQGGWIVSTSSGYAVVPFTATTSSWCGIDGEEPAPAGTVGWVHTHPYKLDEAITNCFLTGIIDYKGKPSVDDIEWGAEQGRRLGLGGPLPGYILDTNGIRRFAKGVKQSDYDRCGY